ncbi:MAG: substrate-binding domain-containing protein [Thermodesulfobacteriota bacterium]|nr:substrate-binding domain-containing protein [Thermodesulfobacteriota bacterium]
MRMEKIAVLLLGSLVSVQLAVAAVCAGDLVVVGNNSVPVDSLDQTTISNIYLGTKTKWDNGDAIQVVMLKQGPTHEVFAEKLVGTTPAKLRLFWKKAIFAGTGRPPKILKTQARVIEYVASTSGAIGYVDESEPTAEVKVIHVTP